MAFVFYDPYDSEQIEQVSALEEKLRGEWRVEPPGHHPAVAAVRALGLDTPAAAAFYDNGKLMGTKAEAQCNAAGSADQTRGQAVEAHSG